MNSTIKLIAIVYNPVNRAFSDYTHVVKSHYFHNVSIWLILMTHTVKTVMNRQLPFKNLIKLNDHQSSFFLFGRFARLRCTRWGSDTSNAAWIERELTAWYIQVIKRYQSGDDDDEKSRLEGFERFAKDYIKIFEEKSEELGEEQYERNLWWNHYLEQS